MLHGKALAIVTAYDMYKECSEGKLDKDWEVLDKKGKHSPVSFHVFRETLARQMLRYNPADKKYLGDDKFRANTKLKKNKRGLSPVPTAPAADGTITCTAAGITEDALMHASSKIRLCGFLGDVTEHFDSCFTMEESKKLTCVYCGKLSYQKCGLCNVAVHKFPQEDGQSACFFRYHDTGCFGLARNDFKITNKKQKDWKLPTMEERQKNEEQMKQLSEQVKNNNGNNGNNGNNNGDSDSDEE
jgi:hypothetical protein